MESDILQEYLSDDEKVEEARQQFLQNLDKFERMVPGQSEQMKAMALDPIKWKTAMGNVQRQMEALKKIRATSGKTNSKR